MASNSENTLVHSLTRAKFDSLWNVALRKENRTTRKKSISREKLCKGLESTETNSDVLPEKHIESPKAESPSKEGSLYILNKFFQESDQPHQGGKVELQTKRDKVKAPVPKPRKHKAVKSSPTVVLSPRLIKGESVQSLSSNKTYKVERKDALWPQVIIKTNLDNLNDEPNSSETENDKDETKTSKVGNQALGGIDTYRGSTKSEGKQKEEKEKNEADVDPTRKVYTYDKNIEIIIHKTERLPLTSSLVHPSVKIHVVDARTGKYFSKSDKTRHVVFFYENADDDLIFPVMTHTCNLQEKRVLLPCWEESIFLNEDIEYFKDNSQHIIVFFELVDFVSLSMIAQRKDSTRGWHNIAFAFIKLSGTSGITNMDRKLRLQLYHPQHSQSGRKGDFRSCNVWSWWKRSRLQKYPSTLFVSINSVLTPTSHIETFRSKTPVQQETSLRRLLFEETKNDFENLPLQSNEEEPNLKASNTTWSRSKFEFCKLPNKCLAKFNSYDDGCFVAKFSYSGLYLACAVRLKKMFLVVIYSIQQLEEIRKFPLHQDMIYDIKWASDDSLIIAASADNTVSIFSLSHSLLQILPHPSFVYCCDISCENVIASGCFDTTVRIWSHSQAKKKTEYCLVQELEAHLGYVTSVCFGKKFNILSADSKGVIVEWQNKADEWILKREIHILDLKETVINQLLLFAKERKLLVHSRDSVIRIVDLKSGCVLQWLRGGLNNRVQVFGTICCCGNYVCSGSENGLLHIWLTRDGSEVAVCLPFPSSHRLLPIHCVQFHPHDNILMVSQYGESVPILLYNFDKNLDQPEIAITMKTSEHNEKIKSDKSHKSAKRNFVRNDVNLDYKQVLQKMDLLISQK